MDNRTLPKPVLIGAALVVGATLLTAGLGSVTGLGTITTPTAGAIESRDLRFLDRDDGGIDIVTPAGDPVDVVPPGGGGFVRGVLRGLAYDRKIRDQDQATPFRLSRYGDGRLLLEDPTTGSVVALNAFGRDNFASFARLMDAGTVAAN